jgi:predicted metalloendopeptidase
VYTLYLSYGTLGLPNVTYYKATAPGKINTLVSYIQFIKKLTNLLEVDDLSETVTFESYFSANFEGVQNDDSILLKGHELLKEFDKFPWDNFFTSYGIEDWKEKTYRIQSKRLFRVLEKAFEITPLERFKDLFTLHMILHALPMLPSPYDTIYFEFYQKRLQGQKEKFNQKYLNLYLIKIYLTTPLSILYKNYYLKNSLKINSKKFIEKIKVKQNGIPVQTNNNYWMIFTLLLEGLAEYDDTSPIEVYAAAPSFAASLSAIVASPFLARIRTFCKSVTFIFSLLFLKDYIKTLF